MVSYIDVADLAEAKSFRTRIKVASVMYAGTVLTDAKPADMSMAEHEKRVSFAARVLASPETQVDSFVWPVLSNISIATAGLSSSDGDLLYQISQVWNNLAGVTAMDKDAPATPGA